MAENKDESLSDFVKSYLPTSKADKETLSIALTEMVPKTERKNVLQTLVSDEELLTIKQNAGSSSLASYLRHVALEGSHPVVFDIKTTDVSELTNEILPVLNNIYEQNKYMGLQSFMQPQQYEKISRQLNDIYQAINTLVREVMTNRNAIKNAELSELRRRIKYAMKKQKGDTT